MWQMDGHLLSVMHINFTAPQAPLPHPTSHIWLSNLSAQVLLLNSIGAYGATDIQSHI